MIQANDKKGELGSGLHILPALSDWLVCCFPLCVSAGKALVYATLHFFRNLTDDFVTIANFQRAVSCSEYWINTPGGHESLKSRAFIGAADPAEGLMTVCASTCFCRLMFTPDCQVNLESCSDCLFAGLANAFQHRANPFTGEAE